MAKSTKTVSKTPAKATTTQPNYSVAMVTWNAPEYSSHKRSSFWFLGLIVFVAAMVIFAYFSNNWLVAVAFILAGFALVTLTKREPLNINHQITAEGVIAGERNYPFSKLKSFWIIEKEGIRVIYFEQTRRLAPLIIFQLGDADIAKIKTSLAAHLPEHVGRDEDIFDKLIRMLKI